MSAPGNKWDVQSTHISTIPAQGCWDANYPLMGTPSLTRDIIPYWRPATNVSAQCCLWGKTGSIVPALSYKPRFPPSTQPIVSIISMVFSQVSPGCTCKLNPSFF